MHFLYFAVHCFDRGVLSSFASVGGFLQQMGHRGTHCLLTLSIRIEVLSWQASFRFAHAPAFNMHVQDRGP